MISRELGRGGMAAVFLAHQLKLDRKVAIKVMAPTLMSGLGLVDRFRTEATTVARLDHPNIISIYEVGQATGLQYFVMQYVAGRSLERVLGQYGQLPLTVTRAILFEVGSALAYAHRQQVIHRDVKPGNVLLSLDGRVIVSDFGIAKVAESSAHTQTGAVVGTPAYMSPEQCLGKPLSPAADQYALGIVAYEMLSGVQPFRGTPYVVMRGHTEEPVPDLRTLRPDCPPNVADAIGRMLSKQPADRFPSVTAALAALGATRMSIDGVEDTLGHLAVPLPGEEGVILVNTPASPAPLHHASAETPAALAEAPPSLPNGATQRFAPLLRLVETTRARAAAALATAATAIGACRLAMARSKPAVRALRERAGAVSTRSRLMIGGVLGVTAITAVIVAMTSLVDGREGEEPREIVRADTTVPAVRDSSPLQTTAVDSASGAVVDSVLETPAEDSMAIAAAVDSTVPDKVTLRYTGRRSPVVAGDTVSFRSTVLSANGRAIRGARVMWSVSDSAIATIDSVKGLLITRRPGSVTVFGRTDTRTGKLVLTVTPAPQRERAVALDSSKRDVRPAAGHDAEADATAVFGALNAFLRAVLPSKNTDETRRLYRGASDDPVFTELLAIIGEQKTVRFVPEPNAPPPTISGDRATTTARIEIKWDKRIGRDGVIPRILDAELERVATGWRVSGFRLSKP